MGSRISRHNQQGKFINDLPDEMLLKIFSYLGPEDLFLKTSKVCMRWYGLSRDITLWRTLTMRFDDQSEVTFMHNMLVSAPALYSLVLHGCGDVAGLLKLLFTSCEELKRLNIKNCKLGDEDGKLLAQVLEHYPSLQFLRLSSCQPVKSTSYALINQFADLISLNLSHCGCSGLTGSALQKIVENCTCLQELKLDNIKLFDNDIKSIVSACKGQLTTLVLDGGLLTDKGFVHLALCTKLTVLKISWCLIMTDEGFLDGVGLIPNLKILRLNNAKMLTAYGFSVYLNQRSVSNLVHLDLSQDSRLDDDGLKGVAFRCPLLKFLELEWCWHITDVGVELVMKHCPIVLLNLLGVQGIKGINFAAIIRTYMPNLEKLNLVHCQNLDAKAVKKIYKAKPNLKVLTCLSDLIDDNMEEV